MKEITQEFWGNLYTKNSIGWDIGYASPPIKSYFERNINKNARILLPGAGNAYEAEFLYNNGFKNIFILDYVQNPITNFLERTPNFPKENVFLQDFFEHKGSYDYIIEQTFFTSFLPKDRIRFVNKVYNLLNDGGKYVGLFFNHEFNKPFPPYGAERGMYENLFSEKFMFNEFDICKNSIKPRLGREFFFELEKKTKNK